MFSGVESESDASLFFVEELNFRRMSGKVGGFCFSRDQTGCCFLCSLPFVVSLFCGWCFVPESLVRVLSIKPLLFLWLFHVASTFFVVVAIFFWGDESELLWRLNN